MKIYESKHFELTLSEHLRSLKEDGLHGHCSDECWKKRELKKNELGKKRKKKKEEKRKRGKGKRLIMVGEGSTQLWPGVASAGLASLVLAQ